MDRLGGSANSVERAVAEIARGAFAGVMGVIAIGVWAVNFEPVFAGNGAGFFSAMTRVALCDAIPIATLCGLYNGLGKNQTIEEMTRDILRSILWFCGGFLFVHTPVEELSQEL